MPSASRDLGRSRKCTSDCQIFEQFQKDDSAEEKQTHFTVVAIVFLIDNSADVSKEAIYSIEEAQRIVDLLKTHGFWWRREKESVQNTHRN